MSDILSIENFPAHSTAESAKHDAQLKSILKQDLRENMFELLGAYQRILADDKQRDAWSGVHDKLQTLFMAGKAVPLNGPMIGIPVSIRDSDYFRASSQLLTDERSPLARLELLAAAWNSTFADTGLWMGKTFEPISKAKVGYRTKEDPPTLEKYDPQITRVGRNFFRGPHRPNAIQSVGLPALTRLWSLRPRPTRENSEIFDTELLEKNAEKEKWIPYSMTGGIFLADMGESVVPEMNSKAVYQLNYRWPRLNPIFPMTCLIDEIVQVGEGIYLGQLVFATKHYALMTIDADGAAKQIGEDYNPRRPGFLSFLRRLFNRSNSGEVDYGYQNNGYFLMMDPEYAEKIYADNAFPQLRPHAGESGFAELGYDRMTGRGDVLASERPGVDVVEWTSGWKQRDALRAKFTSLILEESPNPHDGNVRELLREDESVLQMLQRISAEVSAQSSKDDHLRHFEKLNQLFRAGVAPGIRDGLLQRAQPGTGNRRIDSPTHRTWYGHEDPCRSFEDYHGATLNLHLGLGDTFQTSLEALADDDDIFPSTIAELIERDPHAPNLLNVTWHQLGKYIFPWAGKSFETISGRKLSMLLDESDDLAERYPERTRELKNHLASAPHYLALQKNHQHYWPNPGCYAEHLQSGAWDQGMSDADKAYWEQEAREHWLFGNNIQDERILTADPLFKVLDMNYRKPDDVLLRSAAQGPSPFARQGYMFLGTDDRDSILSMNNGPARKKKVFQFHYRYPMIGGPAPIGYCLDELVEIADGLFLGQLIYATAFELPFQSSVDPDKYNYQLFGYFLLMDDDWQRHRLAIGLDTP